MLKNIFSIGQTQLERLHKFFCCSYLKKRKRKVHMKRVYPIDLNKIKKSPDFTGNAGDCYLNLE
jgi:hypothetical protein